VSDWPAGTANTALLVGSVQRGMNLTTHLGTAKKGMSVKSRVCLKIASVNLSVWKQFWIFHCAILLDRPLVVSVLVFRVRKGSLARYRWERLL
jgi:hypothetical protein